MQGRMCHLGPAKRRPGRIVGDVESGRSKAFSAINASCQREGTYLSQQGSELEAGGAPFCARRERNCRVEKVQQPDISVGGRLALQKGDEPPCFKQIYVLRPLPGPLRLEIPAAAGKEVVDDRGFKASAGHVVSPGGAPLKGYEVSEGDSYLSRKGRGVYC